MYNGRGTIEILWNMCVVNIFRTKVINNNDSMAFTFRARFSFTFLFVSLLSSTYRLDSPHTFPDSTRSVLFCLLISAWREICLPKKPLTEYVCRVCSICEFWVLLCFFTFHFNINISDRLDFAFECDGMYRFSDLFSHPLSLSPPFYRSTTYTHTLRYVCSLQHI